MKRLLFLLLLVMPTLAFSTQPEKKHGKSQPYAVSATAETEVKAHNDLRDFGNIVNSGNSNPGVDNRIDMAGATLMLTTRLPSRKWV